jgi:YfiH family protein
VGDEFDRVEQNKAIGLKSINRSSDNVFDLYQVHSTDVIIADTPRHPDESHQKGDAILTIQPDLTLLMRFADCVPIFIYDPVVHAAGIIHAGWKGTINKIAEKVISKMRLSFGSKPQNIIAGIGPSIGPDHYFVRQDVSDLIRSQMMDDADQCLINLGDKIVFDLWKANQLILNNIGVEKVEIAGICTQCHMEDWYSHRGENGRTGRFGAVIGLQKN